MIRSSRHGCIVSQLFLHEPYRVSLCSSLWSSLCSPLWFFPVWPCGLVTVGSSLCSPCVVLSCGPSVGSLGFLWSACPSCLQIGRSASLYPVVWQCRGSSLYGHGAQCDPVTASAKDTDRPPVASHAQRPPITAPWRPDQPHRLPQYQPAQETRPAPRLWPPRGI